MEIVPHICENFCGAYLPGVIRKEITVLLEIVLIRDIGIAEKKKKLPKTVVSKSLSLLFPTAVIYIV